MSIGKRRSTTRSGGLPPIWSSDITRTIPGKKKTTGTELRRTRNGSRSRRDRDFTRNEQTECLLEDARDHRRHRRCRSSPDRRSEEHTSELQSQSNLVCRLLLEKKK